MSLVASAVCVGSGRARDELRVCVCVRLWDVCGGRGGRSVHCAKASCN